MGPREEQMSLFANRLSRRRSGRRLRRHRNQTGWAMTRYHSCDHPSQHCGSQTMVPTLTIFGRLSECTRDVIAVPEIGEDTTSAPLCPVWARRYYQT